ncbi:MAG: Bug family tripartite tricarboxylate transporter substrate binding protein [Candidatus Binataceae bacterium]
MRWVVQLVICGLAAIAPARAEQHSDRPVTIVVPYAAGGPTDQLARQIAPALSKKLNQTVIVENISGGGTLIATGRVARAAPDGHTLLLHNLQISANVSLYANIPFDTEKDLAPIIFINHNPLVLAGRKTLTPNTLPELITYMKANEAKIAYPGVGATGHLATSLFLQEAQLKGALVPYRGAAPALQDLLGGHVDLFFATPQSVVEFAGAGSVKVYGITAREKSAQFPEAESLVQALGAKLEILYWHALFAPAGTPESLIERMNAAIQEIVDDPVMLKAWANAGVAPFPKDQRSAAAARSMLKDEIARWGQVVRDNHIQGQM